MLALKMYFIVNLFINIIKVLQQLRFAVVKVKQNWALYRNVQLLWETI